MHKAVLQLSKKIKICLVTPSFSSGGAERVLSQLAKHFAAMDQLEVTIVSLIRAVKFYPLPPNVQFIEPTFEHKQYSRAAFTIKIYRHLRSYLKQSRPDIVVSFGGKYNSFVLLAARGLGIRTFVSERSRPNISYGKFLDRVNPYMYKKATGIIAQTGFAKNLMAKRTGHKNIISIPNPIPVIENTGLKKENIILNVGRFIKSKNQSLLLEYFAAVREGDWKLVFLGDGHYLEATKQKAIELGIENWVSFPGVVQDVESYYAQSKIFAFTSVSEGFPNALGEALSASLGCISFNCVAGPADLIEDGVNGFLVEELNHEEYKRKLKRLMTDELLRHQFEAASQKHMEKFATEKICDQYLNFILVS